MLLLHHDGFALRYSEAGSAWEAFGAQVVDPSTPIYSPWSSAEEYTRELPYAAPPDHDWLK
jgi:hypothetical protein